MRTQVHEALRPSQPPVSNTLKIPDISPQIDLTDLQSDYRAHQKALLKELHIKDKTNALRDPAIYFKLLTWQVMERCFDRVVWSRAMPAINGQGYAMTANCAVFSTNSVGTMEPTFWAKVSYHTPVDLAGRPQLDDRDRPLLEADGHTVETDLQGLKRYSNIHFRFQQNERRPGVQAQQFQRMGRAVLLDEFDTMRYMDTFGDDVLAVVHNLDQLSESERAVQDRLAYVATHHLVHNLSL